jgi:hypothetical protein
VPRSYSGLEFDYVCNPSSLRLNAKEDLTNRKVIVKFTIGERTAHEWQLRVNLKHCGNADQLHKLVTKLIEQFMNHSKVHVQNRLEFLAYNVWNGLKEVKTKSGTLIWSRQQ